MAGVNLIPESVWLAQARRRHVRHWALWITLAACAVAVLSGIEWFHEATAAELRARNDTLQSELETVRGELVSLTSEAHRVHLQIERAKALRSKRAWSGMLAMIASCMSPGAWLTSIATDPPTPPEGGARSKRQGSNETDESHAVVVIEAPRRLRISGYALEDAHPDEMVVRLKNAEVFTRVVSGGRHREPMLDGSYFRFELVCEW